MQINVWVGPDFRTIELVGRFDAYETAAFRAAMLGLVAPGATIKASLSAVEFIDSSGLAELLRATQTAAAAGGRLILVSLSEPVRVIFELTAVDIALNIEPAAIPSLTAPQV
jgi:anti-sigma B factor antagonist